MRVHSSSMVGYSRVATMSRRRPEVGPGGLVVWCCEVEIEGKFATVLHRAENDVESKLPGREGKTLDMFQLPAVLLIQYF
jgi:hypothetical protein